MSRALLIIRDDTQRQRAVEWCRKAPVGTRILFKEEKRSTAQSDRMWAMLTDVASQKDHFGRRYSAEIWKLLFMNELGRESKFVPALDGSTVVPIGYASSDLSKREMSDLIALIEAWGAEHDVVFHAPKELSKAEAA